MRPGTTSRRQFLEGGLGLAALLASMGSQESQQQPLNRLEDRLLELTKVRDSLAPTHPIVEQIRTDPGIMLRAMGWEPAPWQTELWALKAQRALVLTSRQAGKSWAGAVEILQQALCEPGSLCVLLSPVTSQSNELFSKVMDLYDAIGAPIATYKRTVSRLTLVNRSRIIALPDQEKNVRGYSNTKLLVLDEAARISDALYNTARPFLAASRGRLLALSTPFGNRGWFYHAWHAQREKWAKIEVPAWKCPHIPQDFLEEERISLGERWFNQEYGCDFSNTVDTFFSLEEIQDSLSDELQPLFPTHGHLPGGRHVPVW
jgi:hypothetical protein